MSKICVAICNYNHERFLDKSIRSILTQDYQDLDVVVVDDSSKNQKQVYEIVEEINDQRIRFIPLTTNLGKWNALNIAFSTTSADACTSHDADDVSLSWRLSHQLLIMQETKSIHNLCGFIHCWNENDINDGDKLVKPKSIKFISSDSVFEMVSQGFKTPGINHYFTGEFETAGVSSMFLRRVWDMGIRFNPPNLGLRIRHSEDSDFNTRLTLTLNSTTVLAETPYLYRRNTSTNSEKR